MAQTVFEVQDVVKIYKVPGGNDVQALNGVSLTVKENEFICVVGPSGCGKTTLLNIVAGLEPYDSGSVTIHGQPVIGPGPDRAVVFQQYALYPWMTVKKNIEFAIKFQTHPVEEEKKDPKSGQMVKTVRQMKYSRQEKEKLAEHYIKMVNLEGFDTPIGPISNMTDFYIVHRLEIECAKACLEMGIEPPFWRSANVPGGDEFNKTNLKKYSPRIKML